MVQQFVDPLHETTSELDFGPFCVKGDELIMVASARWMYYDDLKSSTPILAPRTSTAIVAGRFALAPAG